MLQLNESIPYVGTEYIKKAIKTDKEVDWSALERDRSLSAWVVSTLIRCVRGRRRQIRGADGVPMEARRPAPCRVCPHSFLFPIKDFIWWVSKGNQNKRRRQCDWWCAACGEQNDWREANRVLTIISKLQARRHLGVQSARAASECMRQHNRRLDAVSELGGEGAFYRGRFKESSRRNMVAALRQCIEVYNHKAWSRSSCWINLVW